MPTFHFCKKVLFSPVILRYDRCNLSLSAISSLFGEFPSSDDFNVRMPSGIGGRAYVDVCAYRATLPTKKSCDIKFAGVSGENPRIPQLFLLLAIKSL